MFIHNSDFLCEFCFIFVNSFIGYARVHYPHMYIKQEAVIIKG